MEQSPSREDKPSATYEIPRLQCKPSLHYVDTEPTIRPDPESNEYNARTHIFEIHFMILFAPFYILLTVHLGIILFAPFC